MIVHVNQIDLYFEERGAGTPVVLLPGYPLDHTIWKEVVPELAEHGRVITPDLRGQGQTDAPEGTYTMRQLADDIAGLLDALEVDQAVIIGHSMGGYVSLAFAQAYPQRLLGLGMVSSQAAADTPDRRANRLTSANEILQNGMTNVADTMPAKLTSQPRLIPVIRKLVLAAKPKGAAGTLRGMAERQDLTSFLPEITVPTLVITGAKDALIPPEKSFEMVQQLPDTRLLTLPDAGHMPMMEFPDQVAEALAELVQRAG